MWNLFVPWAIGSFILLNVPLQEHGPFIGTRTCLLVSFYSWLVPDPIVFRKETKEKQSTSMMLEFSQNTGFFGDYCSRRGQIIKYIGFLN